MGSGKKPMWLKTEEKPTRYHSQRQESKLAKILNGKVTFNSGATFGENDVVTDFCEVEAKTTRYRQFSLKVVDWELLKKKCAGGKIPVFITEFREQQLSLATISVDDLMFLINAANKE